MRARAIRASMLTVIVATSVAATTEPAGRPGKAGLPTVWLVGDSTVHNGTRGEVGWGEPFAQRFDPAKVRVVNRAMGGRSSRTFLTEGRWDAVVKELRPGDVVLIQFGHNDGGPLVDATRSRGSIRGTGDDSKTVTLTDGRTEVVHTFGWYLRRYVVDARSKGATPVLCSWVPHCPKPGDKVVADPASTNYRQLTADVAASEKVDFIDLYGLVWHHYVGMTPAQIKATYFTDADDTHTSPAGAELNAGCVVEGLKRLTDVPEIAALKPTSAP